MKSKKVHLFKETRGVFVDASCGYTYSLKSDENNTVKPSIFFNLPEEQQCKNCMKTKYYQGQEQKMENERKASSEELGYEVEHFTKHQLCPYELGKSGSWINSLDCRRCDYNEYFSDDKTDVKCSFKAKNTEKQRILNTIPTHPGHDKCIVTSIKTQLELDTIKYNLSDEHVEILSKVDYEIVGLKKSLCTDCLLGDVEECPEDANGNLACCHSGKQHIFKQIHKTQESLNESIEKEEVKKGIEEPFKENNCFDHAVKVTTKCDLSTKEMENFIDSMEAESNKIEDPCIWVNNDAGLAYDNTTLDEQNKSIIKETKQESKYHINYHSMSQDKNVVLDVYDLLDALDLPNAEIEHTFKKIVRCGKGDKSLLEDLTEAKNQLEMGINRIKNKIK